MFQLGGAGERSGRENKDHLCRARHLLCNLRRRREAADFALSFVSTIFMPVLKGIGMKQSKLLHSGLEKRAD